MGCPLAPGPAEGARAGWRAGRFGRRCARLVRAPPDEAADRSSADTGKSRRREGAAEGASTGSELAKDQRKDFWWG